MNIFKKKNKTVAFLKIPTLVVMSIVVLLPLINKYVNDVKKNTIRDQCREIVIAVETYNSEVSYGNEIVKSIKDNMLVINRNTVIKNSFQKTNLKDILNNVRIQNLLGDNTNKFEDVQHKTPNDKLKKKFKKIPNEATYDQIKRVAEGAEFIINSKGILYKVENELDGYMEEIDMSTSDIIKINSFIRPPKSLMKLFL